MRELEILTSPLERLGPRDRADALLEARQLGREAALACADDSTRLEAGDVYEYVIHVVAAAAEQGIVSEIEYAQWRKACSGAVPPDERVRAFLFGWYEVVIDHATGGDAVRETVEDPLRSRWFLDAVEAVEAANGTRDPVMDPSGQDTDEQMSLIGEVGRGPQRGSTPAASKRITESSASRHEVLYRKYLQWSSAVIARRISRMDPEQVISMAVSIGRAAPDDPAVESYRSAIHIVTERFRAELPSYERWLERHRSDPKAIEAEIQAW